jgi:hypothetical protein
MADGALAVEDVVDGDDVRLIVGDASQTPETRRAEQRERLFPLH